MCIYMCGPTHRHRLCLSVSLFAKPRFARRSETPRVSTASRGSELLCQWTSVTLITALLLAPPPPPPPLPLSLSSAISSPGFQRLLIWCGVCCLFLPFFIQQLEPFEGRRGGGRGRWGWGWGGGEGGRRAG